MIQTLYTIRALSSEKLLILSKNLSISLIWTLGGQNTEKISSPFTLEIKSQIYVYLSLDISGALGHGLEVPVG